MSEKQFVKKEDLANYLTSSKNIDSTTLPFSVFDEKTYASLISPYTCLVANGVDSISGKKIYSDPTDFKLFLECNTIDASISHCLYIYISAFEKRLRNFVIETLCSKMFDDGDISCSNITKIQNYINGSPLYDFIGFNETPSLNARRTAASFIENEDQRTAELVEISDIENKILSKRNSSFKSLVESVSICKNKKSVLDSHYINKYGFIPLYIGMHSLTFGEILSIYSVFNISDKNIFMRGYYRNESHFFSENDAFKFESRIKRINDIRNVIAHNEPVFPLIVNDKRIAGLASIFEKLRNNYAESLCKPVGSILIAKFSLITKNSYNCQFYENIEKIIESLST